MVFSYLKTNLPNFENWADGLSRDFTNDFNSYFVHILIEIHNILPVLQLKESLYIDGTG